MKHWKIYGLLVLAIAMTVGITSCKDEDDITVQEISVYKTAYSGASLYKGDRIVRPRNYTDAQKAMMEALETKAKDLVKSIKADTINPNQALAIFKVNADKVLEAFKDGINELAANNTIRMNINLDGGATSPYCESVILISKDKAEYLVEPRLAKIFYNMMVPSVEGAEKLSTVMSLPPGETDSVALDQLLTPLELTDSIAALGWPKRDTMKDAAVAAFNADLPKAAQRVAKIMSPECCPNLSDTVAVTIQYCLNFGEGVIVKNQFVKFTNKGYEILPEEE